ncbi:APC family permease [Nocardioides sp. BP30]|uniref:APC family permease n=1 Tax=Nocardioides sp. BP30 TaxID=3036374 RepID=UPI0024687CDA|nr:APC family permease [Nocardioides sp. BP30]WGL52598.1 APC family permease [Nocardioides sp. BP30]
MSKQTTDANIGLTKSLGRLDLIFFTIAATLSIDTIGAIAAGGGGQSLIWGVVVAVTFLVPYAFITAELGSAFPQEGGPYFWVKFAFGRFAAAIATMLWWVTNPVWLGGSLAFLAATTWETYIHPMGAGSFGDYAFKLIFIWLGILAAVVSIRLGKYFLNVGTVIKLGLVGFFLLSVVIYAATHGLHGAAAGDYKPTLASFLAVTPLMLFAFSGYEAENGAAEEMRDPQKDVPVSVAVSGSISTLAYLVPVVALIMVVPVDSVTGAGGFMSAIQTVFSVYGGAQHTMLDIIAVLFIFTLLHQGAAWMIGSDRVQAMAGADGSFPRYFGTFHPKLETPVRVNLLSGVIASVFCVLATRLISGTTGAIFAVVLTIAITTLLLSYLIILPAVWRLRRTHPDVVRPFRIPGARAGLYLSVGLAFVWVAFGSFVAVFPGVLEHLLGVDYDFEDTWSVSRLTFETFTIGTLVVVIGIAVLGYAWRSLRGDSSQAPADAMTSER